MKQFQHLRFLFEPRTVYLRYELGALLRMAVWQQNGIDPETRLGLPSLHHAINYYLRRQFIDPDILEPTHKAYPLFTKVLVVGLTKFASPGLKNPFGPFLLIEDPKEDAFCDAIANLLWKNRKQTKRQVKTIVSGSES